MYADNGDDWLDEDAPIAGGGVTTTALTAEQNARDLFDGDTVVPRFGLFTGPDSGSTLATLEAARDGASVAFGLAAGVDPPAARGERLGGARARGHDPPTDALGINIESRCRHVGPGDGDHCH